MTGTGRLLRLHLRISRRYIVIWTIAMGVLVAGSVWALREAYPDQAALQARAMLLHNPSAVMMTGPAFALDHYTFGAMVANELLLWVLVPTAIMSVLLTVRHTRAEEESGRLEMLRSLPVGRQAPALATLIIVAIANLAVGVAVGVGLVATDLPVVDAVAVGLAVSTTGLVFGGFAAVAAQLTENAQAASGVGLAVIAVAFLVRGVGDVIDPQGSWLSWLSPLAWAQQTKVFVDLRWWPLAVSGLVIVGLLVVTVALSRRRDLGAGLRPARLGPATAASYLLTPAGLAARLLRGAFIGWAIGLFAFAIAMGALANSVEGMLDDIPGLTDWVAVDVDDITRSFAAVILAFLSVGPITLTVAGVLRLRGEESAGRLDGVISSGGSRLGLLAGWVGSVGAMAAVVQVLIGVGVGLGVALGTGTVAWVPEVLLASLVYLPAIILFGAIAIALWGLLPALTALAWLPVGWSALVLFLGGLLNLPDWASDLSPLAHVPLLPGGDLNPATLSVMVAVAVALAVIGAAGLRRRDLG